MTPSPSKASKAHEQSLAIAVDTVCLIVDKLREYENADLLADAVDDDAQDPSAVDGEGIDIHTGRESDRHSEHVPQELESFINDLPQDQQIDLVALMWLGRNNGSAAEWPSIREEASQAHNARTAIYLLGTPMASNFLEEGLSTLGCSCEDTPPTQADTSWGTP